MTTRPALILYTFSSDFSRIRYSGGEKASSAEEITLALPQAFSKATSTALALPPTSFYATNSAMTLNERVVHPLLPFAVKGLAILCFAGGPPKFKQYPQPRPFFEGICRDFWKKFWWLAKPWWFTIGKPWWIVTGKPVDNNGKPVAVCLNVPCNAGQSTIPALIPIG